MDEWTVVVCESGYYGKDCRQQCSINCNVTTHCNKVTGQCEGGCKPGWTGSTCNQSMNFWLLFLKQKGFQMLHSNQITAKITQSKN